MLNGAKLIILSDTDTGRVGLRLLLAEKGIASTVLTEVVEQDGDGGRGTTVLVYALTERFGIATCSSARERMPNARIALVASAQDRADARRAFVAGADGFIGADVTPDALVHYLQLIALGEKVMPSSLVTSFATTADEESLNKAGHMLEQKGLSDREAEVLQHLTAGEANKVIALKLGISEATVKIHVKALLRKLHVQNRTQAAIWADHNGLGNHSAMNVVPFTPPANLARLHSHIGSVREATTSESRQAS